MLKWLNPFTLPNIHTPNDYYFVPENYDENILVLNSHSVKVISADINQLTRGTNVLAIPKDFLNQVNPLCDFTIAVTVATKDKSFNFPRVQLKDIITKETLSYSNYLSMAIMAAGTEVIDFGEEFLYTLGMMLVPKLNDVNIIQKLNKAINECVLKKLHKAEFKVDSRQVESQLSSVGDEKECEFTITATVEFSEEMSTKWKDAVIGWFKLPSNPSLEMFTKSTLEAL